MKPKPYYSETEGWVDVTDEELDAYEKEQEEKFEREREDNA